MPRQFSAGKRRKLRRGQQIRRGGEADRRWGAGGAGRGGGWRCGGRMSGRGHRGGGGGAGGGGGRRRRRRRPT